MEVSVNTTASDIPVARFPAEPGSEPQKILEPYKTEALGRIIEAEFTDWSSRHDERRKSWIRYMRNQNGIYDEETLADIINNEESDVFPKLTRMMSGMAMSKLTAILLPKNGEAWSLDPSPLPEISEELRAILPPEMQNEQKAIMLLAKESAYRMERQIRDRLINMKYRAKLLSALADCVWYGTMVWRGPLKTDKPTKKWQNVPGEGFQKAVNATESEPIYDHISIWKVFPDPYASCIEEATGVIIRHVMNSHQLRLLAKDSTFNKEEINEVIYRNPNGKWQPITGEQELVQSSDGGTSDYKKDRFQVLESWRFCSGQDLRDIGMEIPDTDLMTEKLYQTWVVDGAVIKIEEADYFDYPPFIFCPYEMIDGSMFGRGVPEQMEDSQNSIGSLVRGLIDNMAWAVGPIAEVDAWRLDPNTDPSSVKPRAVLCTRRTDNDITRRAIEFYGHPMVAGQILPAIQYFTDLIQYQTSIPFNLGGFGTMGSGVRTVDQQNQVMQSMESFIRLVVTVLDTKFIEPFIEGLYNWEMAFNPDASIKGDFRIVARGVSGAMAREVQALRRRELFQLASQTIPERMKIDAWQKGFNRDYGFDDDDLFYSDEEWAQLQKIKAESEANIQTQARRYKAEPTDKEVLTSILTSTPSEDPTWAPLLDETCKLIGIKSPILYQAISAHMQILTDKLAREGSITPEDQAAMSQDFNPPKGEDGKPSPIEIEQLPPDAEDVLSQLSGFMAPAPNQPGQTPEQGIEQ